MSLFRGWKRDVTLSWVKRCRGQQISLSSFVTWTADNHVCCLLMQKQLFAETSLQPFIEIWSSWWHLQCHTSAMNVDLATGNSIGENWREFLTLFGILTSPWFNQSESFLTIDVNFLFKYIGWRGHFRSNFCSDRLPLQEEVATNFHRLDPKTSITTGASTPYCNEVSPRKTKEETRNNTSNNIGES